MSIAPIERFGGSAVAQLARKCFAGEAQCHDREADELRLHQTADEQQQPGQAGQEQSHNAAMHGSSLLVCEW